MSAHNKYQWLFFSVLVVLLTACSQSAKQSDFNAWAQESEKLRVLSTTSIVNDLVQRVGGEHIRTLVLIQGELDPHSYQLVKGDDEKLAHAQIIFASGLGLEHGPSLQHYLLDSKKTISLGAAIEASEPQAVIYIHGQKDPHVWMDISLWKRAVPAIVESLSAKDPMHAQDYVANGAALMKEMDQTHEEVKQNLHRIPEQDRYLVTSHDAFNYFARAYLTEAGEVENKRWEKRFAAPEGLAPESQLSTTHIKEIIDHLKVHQIRIIFPESNVSRDSIRKIVQAAREEGLNVRIACCPLYGDAMGPAGSDGDTYLKMILHNANMLSTHMINPDQKHQQDK